MHTVHISECDGANVVSLWGGWGREKSQYAHYKKIDYTTEYSK